MATGERVGRRRKVYKKGGERMMKKRQTVQISKVGKVKT
jgi:hypothetical protein